MKKNAKRMLPIVMAVVAVAVLAGFGDTCTDDELRQDVREFLTTRVCGNYGKRILVDEIRFDGNTNRLANILVEFAQTNDEWVASKAVRQLGEYGTPAQLPFLYSCATNPVVGDRAVKSILRIEGVTSNSLLVAQSYLSLTNGFPSMNADVRSEVCRDIVGKIFSDNALADYRPLVMDIACDFARDVNVLPKGIDKTLVAMAPDFRFTKRRLAVLRSARERIDAKFQSMETNIFHYAIESHIYDVQTNYLVHAINELVAYPEASLPE